MKRVLFSLVALATVAMLQVVALAGIAIGVGGTLVGTKILASLLYGVKATDPATFTVVALLLSCVVLLACHIPARRATRVDPIVALHEE